MGSTARKFRLERDLPGPLEVPSGAFRGVQTPRATVDVRIPGSPPPATPTSSAPAGRTATTPLRTSVLDPSYMQPGPVTTVVTIAVGFLISGVLL